jgi:hypothetical protein
MVTWSLWGRVETRTSRKKANGWCAPSKVVVFSNTKQKWLVSGSSKDFFRNEFMNATRIHVTKARANIWDTFFFHAFKL